MYWINIEHLPTSTKKGLTAVVAFSQPKLTLIQYTCFSTCSTPRALLVYRTGRTIAHKEEGICVLSLGSQRHAAPCLYTVEEFFEITLGCCSALATFPTQFLTLILLRKVLHTYKTIIYRVTYRNQCTIAIRQFWKYSETKLCIKLQYTYIFELFLILNCVKNISYEWPHRKLAKIKE